MRKYGKIAMSHEFVGFAVKTMGRSSDGTQRFIQEIRKILDSVSGDKTSKTFLIQRISIEIQRGNSANIL